MGKPVRARRGVILAAQLGRFTKHGDLFPSRREAVQILLYSRCKFLYIGCSSAFRGWLGIRMPFLLSKIGCIASAAKLDGYAATIEGLPGGPPLAHWGLGEVGGTEIRDRKETRHGTYSGTIGYGAAGLPQGSSNAAIDFGAVGHGTVAHDSGLLLSAFTLSFWFQQHGLPHVEVGSLMPILTKDTSAGIRQETFLYLWIPKAI